MENPIKNYRERLAKKKKLAPGMKTTRKERRKRFGKWINMDLYHQGKGRGKKIQGTGEGKLNIMSNKNRRNLGMPQDKGLPDFQEEKDD